MECVAFDHCDGLPPVTFKGRVYDSVWIIVDLFSKHTWYIPSPRGATTDDLVEMYTRRILPNDGIPNKFLSDNAPTYVSAPLAQSLYKALNIQHPTPNPTPNPTPKSPSNFSDKKYEP